jgi:putative DNA primase/helicase
MPTKRNPEGKFVTFRCPHDLRLDVERLADEHDVTLAQICRKGLRMVMTEMAVTTTADNATPTPACPRRIPTRFRQGGARAGPEVTDGAAEGAADVAAAPKPIPTLRGVPEAALLNRLTALKAKPEREGDGIRCEGICHGGDNRRALVLRPAGRTWRASCYGCRAHEVEIFSAILADGPLPQEDGDVADWEAAEPHANGHRPDNFTREEVQKLLSATTALRHSEEMLRVLEEERRITRTVALDALLGWARQSWGDWRILIPYIAPFERNGHDSGIHQLDKWLPKWLRKTPEDEDFKLLSASGPRWLYIPPQTPELIKGKGWAVLAEGAMDALAVVSAGLPAIGVPSATAWKPAWTEDIVKLGATTLYLPADADDAGRKLGQRVRDALEPAGIQIVRVDLPGLEEHGDVTDFLKGFGSIAQGGQALLKLCQDAEPKPDGLEVVWASDVIATAVQPLLPLSWGYRVPLGMLTLLGGREDIGKTTTACQIAADVSNGELGTAGRVVLVFTSEDSASAIKKRLMVAKADMSKVAIIKRVRRDGEWHGFRIPRDAEHAEKLIGEHHPALVIFVGSLMAHFEGARTNTHRTTDMREALEPVHDLAERYSLAALAVVHPNKNRHADVAMAISESAALIQSARSALWLEWEDESHDQRVIAHFKHNESIEEIGLTYRMVAEDLGDGLSAGHMVRTGTTKLTANELYARRIQSTSGERKVSKIELAENLLKVLLGDGKRHLVEEAKPILLAAGLTESTIERAKRKLDIKTDKTPKEGDHGSVYFWTLRLPFKRDRSD